MKVGVRIMPRPEVLDTQGRAVHQMLSRQGVELGGCRIGKYVELDLSGRDEAEVRQNAKRIAEMVLHNPLIETYEIEVLS